MTALAQRQNAFARTAKELALLAQARRWRKSFNPFEYCFKF